MEVKLATQDLLENGCENGSRYTKDALLTELRFYVPLNTKIGHFGSV